MLIVILYRFCGPRPRGHHNSYAERSKMAVPVILSLVVVMFVSNPVETVLLEVDSKISYFRLAPGGTTPKRSKLAFRSQGAPWSGGRLFSWPNLDMSISEFRMYTSDEPLAEEKSWMTYAGCQIPIFCQSLYNLGHGYHRTGWSKGRAPENDQESNQLWTIDYL